MARTATSWRAVAAVIACLSVFDVTLGLTYPLLSLILEARGISATWVGANAAMTPLGLVLAAPAVLPLARRLGSWRLALLCIATTAATLVLLRLSGDLRAWFLLRFLLGGAIGMLFALSEAWINALATEATRGRIIGLYSSVLSLGFATGPFLLTWTGSVGWTPFVVALTFLAWSIPPLLWARDAAPDLARDERASLGAFASRAPTMLAAVAAFAIFDTAIMALFPVYALRHGMSEAAAASAVGVLIVGNVVLQPVIGWIADRWSRQGMLLCCALLTACGSALVPAVMGSAMLWPLVLVWGAAGFGVYTMALADLGARFSGPMVVAGAAAFTATWGVGGILGPVLGGSAMQHFGPHGLPFMLGVTFLGLAAILGARRSRVFAG